MSSLGLVPLNTVDDLIKQKFESPLPRTQDDDDPFIKGEFDVIKELLEKVADAVTGKAKVIFAYISHRPTYFFRTQT